MGNTDYLFLPEVLREEVKKMSSSAEPGAIVAYLQEQGLSRAEVVVSLVEVLGYSPIAAKQVLLENDSSTCVEREDLLREAFSSLPGEGK